MLMVADGPHINICYTQLSPEAELQIQVPQVSGILFFLSFISLPGFLLSFIPVLNEEVFSDPLYTGDAKHSHVLFILDIHWLSSF